ncbi:LysM peptidoglycan-binding domain-containing protein [Methylocystis parvus]|uniref:DUF5134 domain-containing protein n=2 Tax=Methylocystis parvus TaxID=134 RepID=A0A6B8MAY7_9HYPH|nr:LysM peptidoglycan-binding domain-containing protein [Methylocystis parvus]QGM99856.1 DUF5134 domain-containing protein [Methylocystis parvus]
MASLGEYMLSVQASVLWIAALCGVLIFHCVHLARGCAECRALHGVHLVMLVGMLYMYAAMAFDLVAAPRSLWVTLYVASSAGVLAWLATRHFRGDSVEGVWVLALAQQIAMIYMWAPMTDWAPAISYGFALYFALETFGWGLKAAARGARSALHPATAGPAPAALLPNSFFDDMCMTIMAASMAYMFLGMQLMMSPPRSAPERDSAVTSGPVAPPEERAGEPVASAQGPNPHRANPPPSSSPESGRDVRSYVVRPGDTLTGISARFYGDARLWRRIVAANPGLTSRRLPIGHTIILPEPDRPAKLNTPR